MKWADPAKGPARGAIRNTQQRTRHLSHQPSLHISCIFIVPRLANCRELQYEIFFWPSGNADLAGQPWVPVRALERPIRTPRRIASKAGLGTGGVAGRAAIPCANGEHTLQPDLEGGRWRWQTCCHHMVTNRTALDKTAAKLLVPQRELWV